MSLRASSDFSATTDKRVAQQVMQVAADAFALGERGEPHDLFGAAPELRICCWSVYAV